MSKDCFLRPANGSHPDISLPHQEVVELGRGPTTKVKEGRCSKIQLRLTSDYNTYQVQVEQVGANISTAAGQPLGRGNTVTLGHKAHVELLEGQFQYIIIRVL